MEFRRVGNRRLAVVLIVGAFAVLAASGVALVWSSRTIEVHGVASTWNEVPFATPVVPASVVEQSIPYSLIAGDGWFSYACSGRYLLPESVAKVPASELLRSLMESGECCGVRLVSRQGISGGTILGASTAANAMSSFVDDPRIVSDFSNGIALHWYSDAAQTTVYLRFSDGAFTILSKRYRNLPVVDRQNEKGGRDYF